MNNDIMLYRTAQLVQYLHGIIAGFILVRMLLKLLGANPGAAFTDFIYGVSGAFIAPFGAVFNSTTIGNSVIEWSAVLALIVYWLIAQAIIQLLSMNRTVGPHEADVELRAHEKGY